jgi:exopolyphosphatase/guanosine-5'-triphosphate,3'-diphosphate pyrophosphatase
MRITRLGEGVDANRRLAPEAIERTIEVLRLYRSVMDDLGVDAARLVATSAVRDAANRDEFLAVASEVVGFEAEILPGKEEGRLAFLGATGDLGPAEGDDLVLDIGGGSTELIVGRDGELDTISIDMGCVRLSERFLGHDPPEPSEVEGAVSFIDRSLREAVSAIPALGEMAPRSRLIGLAGTVSTLATLEQGLAEYDRLKIHHFVLTAAMVQHWCATLASESAAARQRRPGMVEGREDVILGGALVLRQVMDRFGFERCLVSESDLLDGLIQSLR